MVLTLTVISVAEFPFAVTLAGETAQVASEGAPVQVTAIFPLRPPAGAMPKVYVAVWPRVRVAEVVDPEAAPSVKSAPVPVRLTACGLPLALSVMVSDAARLPLAEGVKVTLMVQLAPAATLAPQVFVWAKSPLLAPVMATPVTVSVAFPELLSVMVCAVLVLLSSWAAKVRLVGERDAAGPVPVPERLTLCGLPEASSVMVSVPVSAPPSVGVKLTLIVQEALAATLLPQLLVWAKSPLMAMLVMVSAAVPVLLSVIGLEGLDVPIP